MYLLFAGLFGGAIGAWLGWPHGVLASVVAAPFGASLLTLAAATMHGIYQAAHRGPEPAPSGARLDREVPVEIRSRP